MALICPGCQSELDPSNTQCPVCLRPLSRKEMMASLNAVRRAEESKRKRPLRLAAAALALFALGYGYKAAQRAGYFVPAPKPVPAQPAAPAPATPVGSPKPAPPAPQTPAAPVALPPSSVQVPGAPTAPGRPQDTTTQEPVHADEWLVHGEVYDLLSLKPAANAKLAFENKAAGETYRANADAKGRYSIHLPKLTDGGYSVSVVAKGYRDDYLEEAGTPFSARTRAGREEAAAEAAQTKVLHVPIFLDKEADLEYNLALLPRQ